MNLLTNGDLLLILDDLFENKRSILEQTLGFKIYEKSLQSKQLELRQLVKSLEAKPLTEELKEADAIHDSTARGVYYHCKGMQQVTLLTAEKQAFLKKIASAFVPSLSINQKSYEDQSAIAIKKEALLIEHQAELQAYPVAPDITLYDLLNAHIQAGKTMHTLLASRADTTSDVALSKSSKRITLRNKTIGLLGLLRDALSHEAQNNDAIDPGTAHKVFDYMDQIIARREDRNKQSKELPAQ